MINRGLRLSSSVLVILVIVVFILKYYMVMVARAEQRVIDLEIGSIKRLFKAKSYLEVSQTLKPTDWEEKTFKSFMQTFLSDQNIIVTQELTKLPKGRWGYLTPTKQLIYHIKEPAFFRSFDRKPYIYFSIEENKLIVSAFKWCKHRTIWGCKQW